MDIFDIFDADNQQYSIQTWQYAELDCITGPGGLWGSISEAKEALCTHLGAPLVFEDIRVEMDDYALYAYDHRMDLAVVYRLGDAMVVAQSNLRSSGFMVRGQA